MIIESDETPVIRFYLYDDNGGPISALAYDDADLSITVTVLGGATTTLTLVSGTAGTYTSSGFVCISDNYYQLGLPTSFFDEDARLEISVVYDGGEPQRGYIDVIKLQGGTTYEPPVFTGGATWIPPALALFHGIVSDVTSSDTEIANMLVYAAYAVILETKAAFTIDLSTGAMNPNPYEVDTGFLYLIVLKAACNYVQADARIRARRSVLIKDGMSTVDMRTSSKSIQESADTICAQYGREKFNYMREGSAYLVPNAVAAVVTSPAYHINNFRRRDYTNDR